MKSGMLMYLKCLPASVCPLDSTERREHVLGLACGSRHKYAKFFCLLSKFVVHYFDKLFTLIKMVHLSHLTNERVGRNEEG